MVRPPYCDTARREFDSDWPRFPLSFILNSKLLQYWTNNREVLTKVTTFRNIKIYEIAESFGIGTYNQFIRKRLERGRPKIGLRFRFQPEIWVLKINFRQKHCRKFGWTETCPKLTILLKFHFLLFDIFNITYGFSYIGSNESLFF